MNDRLTVGLYVICHDRPADLRAALDSASGFDEVIVLDMASTPALEPLDGVHLIRSDENLWVAGGRNLLAANATSDVLVFLDDDAVFLTADPAQSIRDAFTRDSPSAVAFSIVRASGDTVPSELPFRGERVVDDRRPCGYFLGGAVAIRRDSFAAAGGYDERYEYSTEEIDLAFTLQREGELIIFDPAIVVEHRPSKLGRAPDPHVPAVRLRNRLLLVREHLPWPVAVVHATAWAARTLREALAVNGVSDWLHAWRDGLCEPIERRPLQYRTLLAIHSRGGRILW